MTLITDYWAFSCYSEHTVHEKNKYFIEYDGLRMESCCLSPQVAVIFLHQLGPLCWLLRRTCNLFSTNNWRHHRMRVVCDYNVPAMYFSTLLTFPRAAEAHSMSVFGHTCRAFTGWVRICSQLIVWTILVILGSLCVSWKASYKNNSSDESSLCAYLCCVCVFFLLYIGFLEAFLCI